MVEKPGFSAFGVVTSTFELARFLAGAVLPCGE
jgi:hypothetical protein